MIRKIFDQAFKLEVFNQNLSKKVVTETKAVMGDPLELDS